MNNNAAIKLAMIIVPTFVITFLSACSPTSNDLSRTEAKKLINNENGYPFHNTLPLETGELTVMTNEGIYGYKPRIQMLSDAGLATGGVSSDRPPGSHFRSSFVTVTMSLTDEGNKYIESISEENLSLDPRFPNDKWRWIHVTVEICKMGEVTGIAYLNEGKTSAKVEYTEICEPTPFGALNWRLYLERDKRGKLWSGPYGPVPKVLESSLVLQRYDDGWRKSK